MMDDLAKMIMQMSYVVEGLMPMLEELKQRRESDLRPADKYLGNNSWKQFEHLKSEVLEAKEAYEDFISTADADNWKDKKDHMIEELVDIQMSCETLITILGLNEQQRMDARSKVIAKNDDRGYYVRMQEGK